MKKLIVIAALLFAASMVQTRADDAQKNWDHHCAMCHGKDGKGHTRMGQRLKTGDLTDPKVQSTFTDKQAVKNIKDGLTLNGKKVMPGFSSKLSDEDIKALVVHLRTLKKK